MTISNSPLHSSRTFTITQDPVEAQRLIVTLKGERSVVESKIKATEEKCQVISQLLSQSSLENSQLFHALKDLSLSATVFYDLESQESFSEGELELYEDQVIDLEDDNEELGFLRDELNLIDEQERAVETQLAENQEVTLLQDFTAHLKGIAAREGTTLFTALTTAAAGAGAIVTVGGIMATAVGVGAIAISANEAIKMIIRHVNDKGAEEHLNAIDLALTNITLKNKQAEESIKKSEELQRKIGSKLGEVELQIDELENLVKTINQELQETVNSALVDLKKIKNDLMEQNRTVEEATKFSVASMRILQMQKEKLEELMTKNFVVEDGKGIENLMDEVTQEIKNIHSFSLLAYDYQSRASDELLKALKMRNEIVPLTNLTYQLIGKIQGLQADVENMGLLTTEAKEKVLQAEGENKKLGDELLIQKNINEQQKGDIKIAKQALEQEKQTVRYGEESINLGTAGAVTIGMATGLVLGGPVLAMGGALVGAIGIGRFAVRGAHYARKALRAQKEVHKENQRQLFNEQISKNEKGAENQEVVVKAEYGYSQGSLLGAWTAKSFWNLSAGATNYLSGKEIMSEWKSAVAGEVNCLVGKVPLNIEFNKQNSNMAQSGAITIPDQLKLSQDLLTAYQQKKINGPLILELLKNLEGVRIGQETVVMISRNSSATKELKETILKDLKNG